jgi:hypothetical protein
MTIQSIAETNETPESKYKRWKDEIIGAEKDLDQWHTKGRKVVKRYIDERDALDADARKFNIFTANVSILSSALYSKIPSVEVDRKFKDQGDDVARVAALIMQRAITQDLDVPNCNFSQIMSECIEDRLVPGLGQAWVRLQTDTEPTEDLDEAGEPIPRVVNQELIVEHVFWEDFLWSPCRTWSERRWVGRRVYMDKDSCIKRFGKEIGNKLPLDYAPKNDKTGKPENEILSKAIVYEIWDRQTKTVVWLSKAYPELLDARSDPLGLDSFEPCPKPLFALTTTTKCVPTPDYELIQDQYAELDDVNNRISRLIAACKVVGVYDRSSEGVQRMMNEGVDNTLIPVDNWAMFAEKGGIKGQIDWLPLDVVIVAIEKLRQAREDIKVQIYELTGISDIARGVTKASETLGAQQIKAQMASIHIQQLQDSVAHFASSIFRIKAQLLAKHFTPEQLLKVSAIEYTPDAQVNPQLIADAITLIKDAQQFTWRVEVDADSMQMADYAAEKAERSEFITSVATYLQSAATMIKEEPGSAPLLVEMLKYATASQKGAKVLEGVMDRTLDSIMQAQQEAKDNPQVDPEAMAKRQEFDLRQAEMKNKMVADERRNEMEMGMKHQQMAFDQEMQTMKLDAERQAMKAEQQRKDMELQFLHDKQQMELSHLRAKQQMELQFLSQKQEVEEEAKEKESENAKEGQKATTASAPVINIGAGRKSASVKRDDSGRINGIEVTQSEG